MIVRTLIAGALLALGPSIASASRYNLQDPNSAIGQSIYDLLPGVIENTFAARIV